jgi:hypothetical protein
MEIEQRYVVIYLHRKWMKLPEIVAKIAAVYHEDAFHENTVKYWRHEIKLHRSDLGDRPSSGGPPLEEIDARILQVLEAEPSYSGRTMAELPKTGAATGNLHLSRSVKRKSGYLKSARGLADDDAVITMFL